MHGLRVLLSIGLFAWLGAVAAAPAAEPDLSTPEAAVTAYIEGVAQQDFRAVMATTAVDRMSKGFDFTAYVERIGALVQFSPAPATDSFYSAINRANFTAQIARQLQFFAYGLLTTNPILEGTTVRLESGEAAEFAAGFVAAVDVARLATLKLEKIGIPRPELLNSDRNRLNMAKNAAIYGADEATDRVAMVSFEGGTFFIGFSLLRYGDEWTITSQASAIGGTDSLGVPASTTPEAFEELTR